MTLGHEKLDVYRLTVGYVACVYEKAESLNGKVKIDRMAAMLIRLVGRGYRVREAQAVYGESGNDSDFDSDFDLEKENPQPSVPGEA